MTDTMTGDNKSGLPRGIWALGFVSMFTDISSEMIHALLPVFLVTVLAASSVTVGIIEGIGEATASVSKLFSGRLSDYLGARKALTVAGYSLSVATKPLFALAPTPAWVLAARFADRVGKGLRDAPRDALVGDLTTPQTYGAAYGLRQALDTVGAFVGPALAILLMGYFANDFRSVFWLAIIPGAIAVAILVFAVREPAAKAGAKSKSIALRRGELTALGGLFWGVIAIAAILTVARFSEAFLVLRAQERGLSPGFVPVVFIVMNVVYAGSAFPFGSLADNGDKRFILAGGFAVLIVADIVLAQAAGIMTVMAGAAFWGLHMGMTQGLLSALVAGAAPAELRGTAFGIFHLVSGAALLCGNTFAGILWDRTGPSGTFVAGAAFAAAGLVSLLLLRPGRKPAE